MITIIGFVTYALLRFYYSLFYGALGVTPEEVGLGYVEVLQLSYAGLLIGLVTLLGVAVVGSALALVSLLMQQVSMKAYLAAMKRATRQEIDLNSPEFRARVSRRRMGRFALWFWDTLVAGPDVVKTRQFRDGLVAAFILALLIGALLLGLVVAGLSKDVKAGVPVHPPMLFGVQVLALRAEPAQVWWTTTGAATASRLDLRGCLRYLGQANGISVFYDAQASQVLRVPAAAIVVAVPATGGPDCKPAP